jgi:hypothetical protein
VPSILEAEKHKNKCKQAFPLCIVDLFSYEVHQSFLLHSLCVYQCISTGLLHSSLGFSRWHYNAPFSTYDHYRSDHTNCPHTYGGAGWWYHFGSDCAHVQLNGRLPTHSDGLVPLNSGILWIGWKMDRHYSFQSVHMAIQRKLKRIRSDRHP